MTTLARYTKQFVQYLRTNKAVSALEYALLVGIIAVALGAALVTFGGNITTAMNVIGSSISSTLSPGTPQTIPSSPAPN